MVIAANTQLGVSFAGCAARYGIRDAKLPFPCRELAFFSEYSSNCAEPANKNSHRSDRFKGLYHMSKSNAASLRRFVKITERFYPGASSLRKVFDSRFRDPKSTRSDRFVWDYWHVPDQYTFVRTPAYHYFPKTIYNQFHRFLMTWGRSVLGCKNISPPWLSYYIDGCGQELHSDVPHGPWAYVFSLTAGRKP